MPVSDAGGARHPDGWQIGRLLGVPVVLARSWFVIAAVITVLFAPVVQNVAPELGAAAYGVAFFYAVLLFVSVLLHELAHAAAARVFGMPATRIVINLWGGHTQFETDATSPGRSFVVAVVGPITNGALALAALPFFALTGDPLTGRLLLGFVITNAFVALFNVVPGLPLDGGRMLEAVVWRASGDRTTGTIAAAWGGRVAAVLLVLGVLLWDPSLLNVVWACLIGALLWSGAGAALQTARIRRRAPSASVRGLARPAVGVPAWLPISEALAVAGTAEGATGPAVVLLSPDGRPAAVLDPAAVASVPTDRRPEVPAHAAARALPAGAEIDARLAGEELLRVLGTLPGEEWAARDETGRVVGLLRADDVVAAVVSGRRSPSARA